MGGIPGQFFRQFGITAAAAVFFSLVVALVIPVVFALVDEVLVWLRRGQAQDARLVAGLP